MPAYAGRDGSVLFADPNVYGTNVFDWSSNVSQSVVETTSPDDGAFTTWVPSIVRWQGRYSAYLDDTVDPKMPFDSTEGQGNFFTGQNTLQGNILILRHTTITTFDGTPAIQVSFRGTGKPIWI